MNFMIARTTVLKTSAATLFALAICSPALAEVNPQAVLDGLNRQMSNQGLEISADSSEMQGSNNVVLNGVKIDSKGDTEPFTMDKLLLEEVTETDNGGFVIGRIAAPAFSETKEGITVSFEGAAIEGYFVAGPDEKDPILKSGIFRGFEVGSVKVDNGGAPMFILDGVSATMSPYKPGGTLDFKGELKDFSVKFENFPDPKAAKTMGDIGYSELSGRGSAEGSWNTQSGQLSANEQIVVDDAATLNFGFGIGGYTPEVVAGLQDMRDKMDGENDQAMAMAMMGLMQQLDLRNITIKLDDASLTGRILDYVAKMQGTDRQAVINQAKGMLPLVLSQLQAPEFAAKVTAAVGTFLDDPQSLKIDAAPAQPVPAAQIMGAAMSNPANLITTLSVDVKANE